MKLVLLIYLVLFSGNVFAQESRCDSFAYHGHYIPFDTIGVKYTSDYIRNKGIFIDHIGDRNLLKKHNICYGADDKIIFDYGEVEIGFGLKRVSPLDYFYDSLSTTIYNNLKMPFGILPIDSLAPCILSIEINSVATPDTVFSDLLRPNMYHVYGAIKPIEVYSSSDGKYIYIYLFGGTIWYDPSYNLSYMVKLIYSSDGKFIGRIVERGSALNYFRFYDCCSFIGF